MQPGDTPPEDAFDDGFENANRFVPGLEDRWIRPDNGGSKNEFAVKRDATNSRDRGVDRTHKLRFHYHYRPGRILVPRHALTDDVGNALADANFHHQPPDERQEDLGRIGVEVEVFESLANEEDAYSVPGVVDGLRRDSANGTAFPGAPEFTLFGAHHTKYGPGTPVKTTQARLSTPSSAVGAGVRVAVLDTGGLAHPWFANSSVRSSENDIPDLDKDGQLDADAGHGTFIAGVVRSYAPAAQIDCWRLLSSMGHVDELDAAHELQRVMESDAGPYDIVNMSFGGPGPGHPEPYALSATIRALKQKYPTTVFVAAAGNNATSTPFYPAATKDVIAVGALDVEGTSPAPFSNYGPWVDCWVGGCEIVSTFLEWPPNSTTAPAAFEGWAEWGGTSFAAPALCGAIAARMSQAGARAQSAADAAAKILDDALPTNIGGVKPDCRRLVNVVP